MVGAQRRLHVAVVMSCSHVGVALSTFNAYRRQLNKWWPDALYAKYSEMDDDGKRQCLVAYLRNPASGGFPSEALSDQPEDRGGRPQRAAGEGSASARDRQRGR